MRKKDFDEIRMLRIPSIYANFTGTQGGEMGWIINEVKNLLKIELKSH